MVEVRVAILGEGFQLDGDEKDVNTEVLGCFWKHVQTGTPAFTIDVISVSVSSRISFSSTEVELQRSSILTLDILMEQLKDHSRQV